MWEIIHQVDSSWFDDVLSIDPGKRNGGACRELMEILLKAQPHTNQGEVYRMGDVERR